MPIFFVEFDQPKQTDDLCIHPDELKKMMREEMISNGEGYQRIEADEDELCLCALYELRPPAGFSPNEFSARLIVLPDDTVTVRCEILQYAAGGGEPTVYTRTFQEGDPEIFPIGFEAKRPDGTDYCMLFGIAASMV